MGTWDYGPFDDDIAADWSWSLNEATPDQREAMIRAALEAVLHVEGYLDKQFAMEAIAAAAVVASQRPAGPPITSTYAPDFLLKGGNLDLPADLDALAVRALDRVVADDSEWRRLWEDVGHLEEALAELATIRSPLVG
jgi:hypothetical protein